MLVDKKNFSKSIDVYTVVLLESLRKYGFLVMNPTPKGLGL